MLKHIPIYYAILPRKISGCCLYFPAQKEFKILLNRTKSKAHNKNTVLHELLHIWRNDFNNTSDADAIEVVTHETIEKCKRYITNDIKKIIRIKLKNSKKNKLSINETLSNKT